MKKILQIRRNTSGQCDGTDNYCRELYRMFCKDAECRVLPVSDIPQTTSLFKYSYNEKVLEEYMAKADIVHINGYTAMGVAKALKKAKQMNKKVVYTAHWHPFEHLHRPLLGKLFFNFFVKPAIKKYADVITTINNDDTRFFEHFFPNVIRIPHSVSNVSSNPTNKKPNMILFVGRINDPVKGFQHVLSLPKGKYEIHCVGKGDIPSDRSDLIQHVDIPESELSLLYDQASLVVIPSLYEAFSYVALEAFLHATPVVMSDRVRIADYLEGTKGYRVFTFGDNAEFMKCVESTIGREVDVNTIKDIFSQQTIYKMYKNVYTSL